MGAGTDAFNSYTQRGGFHVIEHQLAAAVELFPIFARAQVLIESRSVRLSDRQRGPAA